MVRNRYGRTANRRPVGALSGPARLRAPQTAPMRAQTPRRQNRRAFAWESGPAGSHANAGSLFGRGDVEIGFADRVVEPLQVPPANALERTRPDGGHSRRWPHRTPARAKTPTRPSTGKDEKPMRRECQLEGELEGGHALSDRPLKSVPLSGAMLQSVVSHLASPSSRGLGRGPFKAKTRVRIPSGTPHLVFLPSRQLAPFSLRIPL